MVQAGVGTEIGWVLRCFTELENEQEGGLSGSVQRSIGRICGVLCSRNASKVSMSGSHRSHNLSASHMRLRFALVSRAAMYC